MKKILLILPLLFWLGCEDEKQEPEDCAGVAGGDNICGCTDITAINYDSTATFDDGSCEAFSFVDEWIQCKQLSTTITATDGSYMYEIIYNWDENAQLDFNYH